MRFRVIRQVSCPARRVFNASACAECGAYHCDAGPLCVTCADRLDASLGALDADPGPPRPWSLCWDGEDALAGEVGL